MLLFLSGVILLIAGYFVYGKFVDGVIAPTDKPTPATTLSDGVDFLTLPHWKNMLIQLLNIAGVGPVIGVILGIKFGEIVFLAIPIGNILGGAAHDYFAGMMSLRSGGANMPALAKKYLGNAYYRFYSIFMCFLLMLVVAVFVNIPSKLIDAAFLEASLFWPVVSIISLYYVCATIFPVDKIIGAIYPFFGAILIICSFAIFGIVVYMGFSNPELLSASDAFKEKMFSLENNNPIIPVMFVTIACGIISGFHATQAPIVARTMSSEKQGRSVFYGMMVLEGLIGMSWAGAAMIIYNLSPSLMDSDATAVLFEINSRFLGSCMGGLTVVGVVILAITSGDTALRSLRLSVSEILGISQVKIWSRILVVLPLVLILCAMLAWSNLSADTFKQLWNYFAWGNQVLAFSSLMCATVWLFIQGKNGWIALIPAAFMAFIVFSYILWISPEHGGAIGLGLDLNLSYAIAGMLSLILCIWVLRRSSALKIKGRDVLDADS